MGVSVETSLTCQTVSRKSGWVLPAQCRTSRKQHSAFSHPYFQNGYIAGSALSLLSASWALSLWLQLSAAILAAVQRAKQRHGSASYSISVPACFSSLARSLQDAFWQETRHRVPPSSSFAGTGATEPQGTLLPSMTAPSAACIIPGL